MSFKKYKLFTDDDIERLRQKHLIEYNPNITALAKLQGEIESILDGNSSVPNDDKLKLLSTLEQRFNSIKQKEPTLQKSQATINSIEKPDLKIPVIDEEEDPIIDENERILDSFEPLMRPRISLLLHSFTKHPELISFDEQQHLILNGIPIENTNIIHSLKRLFRIKIPGKSSVKGQKSFNNLLAKIPLPKPLQNIIVHAKPRPPGEKHRALKLY